MYLSKLTGVTIPPSGKEASEATDALSTTMTELYFEQVSHAAGTRQLLPRKWREVEQFGDDVVYLTAGELTELRERSRCCWSRTANASKTRPDARKERNR